jgi:hypothetical protein
MWTIEAAKVSLEPVARESGHFIFNQCGLI